MLGAGESFNLALEVLTLRECLPLRLPFREKGLEQPPPGVEGPRGLGCVWLGPAGGESLPSVCNGLEGERVPLVSLQALTDDRLCARHCSEHQEHRTEEDTVPVLVGLTL